jgi:hypothetical protein
MSPSARSSSRIVLSPEEVRKHLQNDYFGQFTIPTRDPFSDDPKTRPTWLNQAIKGMICEACNNGWARQLEEEAGTNLYDFSNLHGHADAALRSDGHGSLQ